MEKLKNLIVVAVVLTAAICCASLCAGSAPESTYADGEPVIAEVNSNPHFKSTFDCTGIDMSEQILSYVKEQLK